MTNGYNRGEIPREDYQPGGTSIWSTNEVVSRICETGRDEEIITRWTWTKYRGKDGVYCVTQAGDESTIGSA